MSQLSYNQEQDIALEGLKDGIGLQDIVTKSNDTENLLFGKFVTIVDDKEAKAPTTAGNITGGHGGVVLASQDVECDSSLSEPGLPLKKPASVMKKGRVWVKVLDACVEGAAVNIRYAGTGTKGAFYGTAIASETAVLPNAKFVTTQAVAGGFALVELSNI